MSKKLVIGGNSEQARHWIIQDLERRHDAGETTLSLSEYTIIHRADQLRGLRNPDGVFIGTWQERRDLAEIVDGLAIIMTEPTKYDIIRQLQRNL
jgi:hypothetical protein